MTQEPPKSNAVLIIIAIIGVLGTIIASTISVIGSYNVEKLRQETELTRIALVSIATEGGATQISMENTLSAPTNTLSPDFLNALQQTYTPYPTYTQSIIPIISTSTKTPEPNLIFEDNFDNGINSQYWQTFGVWSVANGMPVVVQNYQSEYKFDTTIFRQQSGLIFPGTAGMGNIAIEYDTIEVSYLTVLLSFVDEYNYKKFSIYQDGLAHFQFSSNGNSINIPESRAETRFSRLNHVRIEIRGNSLNVLVDGEKKYEFKNLPETLTGAVGFASNSAPQFDNFKIYQLP